MDSLLNKMPKSLNSILGKPDSNASKVSFVVVLLVVIYILIKVILFLLTQYHSNISNETVILSGKLLGSDNVEIKTMGDDDVVSINRSINETHGLEFTYTMWLNITLDVSNIPTSCTYNNDIVHDIDGSCNTSDAKFIHIFSKGGNTPIANSMKEINCPGIYLGYYTSSSSEEKKPTSSNLYILCDTDGQEAVEASTNTNIIVITHIPNEKWFNLAIIAKQNIMYIYINGKLKVSKKYDGVIHQNNDNYIINDNGLTNYGSISDISYYPKALNIFELQSKVNKSVSTSMSEKSSLNTNAKDVVSFNYDWMNR